MMGTLSGAIVAVVGDRQVCGPVVDALVRLGAHAQRLDPGRLESGEVAADYYDAVVWPQGAPASPRLDDFRRAVVANGAACVVTSGAPAVGDAPESGLVGLPADATPTSVVEAVAAAVVRRRADRVEESSLESFPASDAAGGTLVLQGAGAGCP